MSFWRFHDLFLGLLWNYSRKRINDFLKTKSIDSRSKNVVKQGTRERRDSRRKRGTRSDESPPRESGFQLSWSSHVIARSHAHRDKGEGGDEKDPDTLDLDPGSRLASIVLRSRREKRMDARDDSRKTEEKLHREPRVSIDFSFTFFSFTFSERFSQKE